jgi:hypothetical protein
VVRTESTKRILDAEEMQGNRQIYFISMTMTAWKVKKYDAVDGIGHRTSESANPFSMEEALK